MRYPGIIDVVKLYGVCLPSYDVVTITCLCVALLDIREPSMLLLRYHDVSIRMKNKFLGYEEVTMTCRCVASPD